MYSRVLLLSLPLALTLFSQTQPEMTTLKSTFIPGDKTIFFDDFTDMNPGDAPPHFKIRGAAPELKAAGDIRQFSIVQRGAITPNLTALPKNFTMEIELKVDNPVRCLMNAVFFSGTKELLHVVTTAMPKLVDITVSKRAPYEELGRKRVPGDWNVPVKIALWVQDGRIRYFVDGEKHLDVNQVELPPITKVEFSHDFYGANQSLGYRSVRFAESSPDFSQTILSSGRYVTHGITFDTNSDRIKPESAPVIQTVAKGLEANPSLRLLIEGHTDSTGAAAANLDLSKRRAEAVKSVLAAQFKIDAARLSTNGLGATKPIDSNDTPLGRSQNRRVEFVKQ